MIKKIVLSLALVSAMCAPAEAFNVKRFLVNTGKTVVRTPAAVAKTSVDAAGAYSGVTLICLWELVLRAKGY